MDFVPSSLTSGASTLVGATLSGATVVGSSTISGATIVSSTINSGNTISPYAVSSKQYIHVNRNNSSQSGLASATYTKIEHNNEVSDASGVYDNATNYRFTPTVSGVYLVRASAEINAIDAGEYANSGIYKNGALLFRGREVSGASNGDLIPAVTAFVPMNGSTDYLEHYVYHNHASSRTVSGEVESCYFQAMWVSK